MGRIIKLHTPPVGVTVIDAGPRLARTASPAQPAPGGPEGSDALQPLQVEDLLAREFERGAASAREAAVRETREALEEEMNRERLRIGTMLLAMDQQLDALEKKAERTVVRLALAVAEQIIKREINLDPEVVLRQTREALRRVMGVGHVKLRVNPIDEQIVREHRSALLSGTDSIREIAVEGDDGVPPGGVIVESDAGNVDARLATQMKKIETALLDDAGNT